MSDQNQIALEDGQVDKKIIDAFVDHLKGSQRATRTPNLWNTILFFETNGFDISRLRNFIRVAFFPVKWQSAAHFHEYSEISPKAEKKLGLGLRQVAREELGLAPLSDAQQADWTYRLDPWLEPGDRSVAEGEAANIKEKTLQFILAEDLEFVRAAKKALSIAKDFEDSPEGAPLSNNWINYGIQQIILKIEPMLNFDQVRSIAKYVHKSLFL